MALRIKPVSRNNSNKEEAIKEIIAEEMVTLTVSIAKKLKEELKIAAIRNNTTITELIQAWAKNFINERK